MKQWAEESESSCPECQRLNLEDHRSPETHLQHHIRDAIATLTANVLELSLIETNLDNVSLSFVDTLGRFDGWPQGLPRDIRSTLAAETPVECQAEDITCYLRKLLDHPTPTPKQGSWVASSFKGQVFIPTLFERL